MSKSGGNAWLDIPLPDYESHMQSAGVGQLRVLSELFAEVLALRKPRSVVILGIAGGNGLEHIDSTITKRVVGVDINPEYLQAVRERYGEMAALELCRADLAQDSLAL